MAALTGLPRCGPHPAARGRADGGARQRLWRIVAAPPSRGDGGARQRLCRVAAALPSRAAAAVATEAPAAPAHAPLHFKDANFPMTDDGRTYHLGTRRGEVAPRVLSVGSVDRAAMLGAALLAPADGAAGLRQVLSKRGFLTVTGRFQGVPVSIVSTHMGVANMDFVVRECRAVVDGPMAVVRFGTCGAVQAPAKLGALLVATASIFVRRDPDAFGEDGAASGRPPYVLSRPVAPDARLMALVAAAAADVVGADAVVRGLNATGDTFYASQGRLTDGFGDRNEQLLAQIAAAGAVSLEMETFHLLDLARCSKGGLRAAALALALAERHTNDFIDPELMARREREGGEAALRALVAMPLE
jgi:uridine phosphorylase